MPYCPSQYSQVYLASLETEDPLTLCTAQEANLNGSAVALYNGTTYYDALMWAAAWMFKATGDSTYLTDSEDFYVRHVYDVSRLGGAACSLCLEAGLPGCALQFLTAAAQALPPCPAAGGWRHHADL